MTVAPPRPARPRAGSRSRHRPSRGRLARLADLDLVLLLAVVGLVVVGSLLVWSATRQRGDPTALVERHLVNTAVGAALCALVVRVGVDAVRTWAPVVYAAGVVGLLAVLSPLGQTINGARSWLVLGGVQLQPAEVAKLALVVGLASLLASRRPAGRPLPVRHLAVVLAVAAVPVALVLAQPDLGSVLVLLALLLGLLTVGGVRAGWLAALAAVGAGLVAAAVRVGVLDGYRLARFAAFADPDLDPRGVGYNVAQARIAVGNGGLTGTGLFRGTQTSGRFVPEQHTDFVFTVAGEELGFLGAGLLVVLLGVVLWRGLVIAREATEPFGGLVCAGVVAWWGFQSFVNVGMCLGIMPVTGLPLPFVSYGGSAMLANLAALGLLLAVRARSRSRPG